MIDISERLRDTPTWLNLLAIQPFTANVPYLNKYFALVYNYFKNTEQKRALQRGETLSDQAFKFTWSWEQFLYDWVYAPNGKPDVDHGPIMSSLWRFFVEDNDDRGFLQVPLPSSCSYARWAKEGVCSFDYAGFGPLFLMLILLFEPHSKNVVILLSPLFNFNALDKLALHLADLCHVLLIHNVLVASFVVH